MATLLIAGGTLLTLARPDAAPVPGDLWCVDGTIAAVGAAPRGTTPDRVIDASGCFVLPGFVQAHVHLVQTLFRGEAEGTGLLEWLRRFVWPLEAAHDESTLRASARLGLAECVEAGVTSILDMGTTHGHEAVLEEIVASGIGGWSGKAMMDLDLDGTTPHRLLESTSASIDGAEALAERFDGAGSGRVRYAYAPRFALSATPELHLEVGARAARLGRRVHTHASETRDEVDAVRRRFGAPCVRHLASVGLGGAEEGAARQGRWTLAHGVHLEDGEVEILARTGAGIAHCPTSNLKLASGIADVPRLRAHGVAVGLGSDGAPCNNRLDPFREMSLAALLPRRHGDALALDARTALSLATLEGARAIGLEDVVGSLVVGKRADVIVLDPGFPSTAPARDPFATVVHAASPRNVRDVFCQGEPLKLAFRPTRFDPRAVAAGATEASRRLLERSGLS